MNLSRIKSNGFIHLIMCYVFLVSGIITNTLQCLNYVTIRQFSKFWYRKINRYLCGFYYALLVYMAEWWGKTQIYLYMDKNDFEKYLGKEHAYGIINHTYEVDWLVGWVFLDKMGLLGNAKAYAKKSIQHLPFLGWCWKFSEFVFLERSFQKDKDEIRHQVSALVDHPDPIWITFYAEGTRPTPERLLKSQKFAKDHGYPLLKHHLFPRTKGFVASIPIMKNKIGALYDVVLSFKPEDKHKTTFHSLLNGDTLTAYVYVRRIPFKDVPQDPEAAVKFLHDLYVRKDKLQDSFQNTLDFFAESGVERLEPIVIQRSYRSLVLTIVWHVTTLVPVLYYWIILFFEGELFYFFVSVFITYILYVLFHKALDESRIKSICVRAHWNKLPHKMCVTKEFEKIKML